MRVALVTSEMIRDGRQDDREVATLLGAEFRVWNDPEVDWESYDRVIIRSPWDYTFHLEAFLAWCMRVGPERLRNPPDLVAFNADKRYLDALAAPTVPTIFVGPGDAVPELDGEIVVKPNVSAGARDTGRFTPADHAGARALITRIRARGRTALIQPYLPDIDQHGETAIVYIGAERSHTLRKRPVLTGQGVAPLALGINAPAAAMLEPDLVRAAPAAAAELDLAARLHAEVSHRFGTPLYARIDLVPGPDGDPVLLELEMIESNLYLEQAPGAAQRFAAAIQALQPPR